MVKKKKKIVPTELGKNATEFLEKYFAKLMDYGFTANMEKQLDDVAEGKLDKLKIIKPFYDYIMEQIKTVMPSNLQNTGNNYKAAEIIGKHDEQDIILKDGPHGPYATHNNHKFNLKSLFEKKKKKVSDSSDSLEADLEAELKGNSKLNNKKSKINIMNEDNDNSDNQDNNDIDSLVDLNEDEENIDLSKLSNDTILNKIIEKIEELKEMVTKEWKIGKKKYILKKGEFGHYVEEWNTTSNKKTRNYSIKFLVVKIAKNNKINIGQEENTNKIIELITKKDIEETIEYFKNKKTTGAKYTKK